MTAIGAQVKAKATGSANDECGAAESDEKAERRKAQQRERAKRCRENKRLREQGARILAGLTLTDTLLAALVQAGRLDLGECESDEALLAAILRILKEDAREGTHRLAARFCSLPIPKP